MTTHKKNVTYQVNKQPMATFGPLGTLEVGGKVLRGSGSSLVSWIRLSVCGQSRWFLAGAGYMSHFHAGVTLRWPWSKRSSKEVSGGIQGLVYHIWVLLCVVV